MRVAATECLVGVVSPLSTWAVVATTSFAPPRRRGPTKGLSFSSFTVTAADLPGALARRFARPTLEIVAARTRQEKSAKQGPILGRDGAHMGWSSRAPQPQQQQRRQQQQPWAGRQWWLSYLLRRHHRHDQRRRQRRLVWFSFRGRKSARARAGPCRATSTRSLRAVYGKYRRASDADVGSRYRGGIVGTFLEVDLRLLGRVGRVWEGHGDGGRGGRVTAPRSCGQVPICFRPAISIFLNPRFLIYFGRVVF